MNIEVLFIIRCFNETNLSHFVLQTLHIEIYRFYEVILIKTNKKFFPRCISFTFKIEILV